MDLIVKAIPFFLGLIALELLVSWIGRRPLYRLNDAVNNLSLGITQEVISLFGKAAMGAMYLLVYEHFSITHIRPSPWAWVGILIGVDFFYYWYHRASHRVAFFWATHVVHHQSEEYNLTVALRQSALGGFFSWIFYLPLAWLGFSPQMFVTSYAINLLYQFWIHTRMIGKLGPVEWVFNTPSHHRVHHGRNPKYIDKNYAGALIIWDRLFGTFVEEQEEPTYGIVHPLRSWNPLWANTHVWVELFRNTKEAQTFGDKLRCFWMPPGWHPSMKGKSMPPVELDLAAPKYDARHSRAVDLYVLVQFVVLLGIVAYFLFNAESFTPMGRAAVGTFILLSVTALGGLFEGKRWSRPLEGVRLGLGTLALYLAPL